MGSAAVEIAVARGRHRDGDGQRPRVPHLPRGRAPTYGAGLAERLATLAPGGVDITLDTEVSGSLAGLVTIVGGPARVPTIAHHAQANRLGCVWPTRRATPHFLAEEGELRPAGPPVGRSSG
ncbi:hypothetical protein GCM10022245_35630 [Streptomyces mayteni]